MFDTKLQAAYLDPALYDAPMFMTKDEEIVFFDGEVDKFMKSKPVNL